MNSLIAWFAKNRVAANLLMVLIIVGGLFSVFSIKKELFPETEMEIITVSVLYPGASPEDVEESVCVRIEEKVQDIAGIKQITSTSSENIGTVVIELEKGYDVSEKLDEVKMRVDAITTFPPNVEKPVIQQLELKRQVINVAIWGIADEKTVGKLGECIRDEIAALPGITQVTLTGVRPYEISVEVSEQALRKYSLTFDHVANALRRSSLDLPGGTIRTKQQDILIRTESQKYTAEDFENVPVVARPDGTFLRIRDVAKVIDGFEETDQAARFNGCLSASVQVYRVGEQDAITVSDAVKKYIEDARRHLPDGMHLTTYLDMSVPLKDRIDLLLRNGWLGFILVFVILTLFLRLRLAFWVSLGIPISFMGALWLLPGFDISINMISLFAFIVVLGIVVDDAIIIGENIHTHQEKTGKPLEGAINGACEMSVPVFFAVLTTMAAFAPLLSFSGFMGRFAYSIPIIVIITLAFSLVESLLVLPAHLSHAPRPKKKGLLNLYGLGDRLGGGFARGFKWFVVRAFQPFLEKALKRRYLTLTVFAAMLALTLGLIIGETVEFIFFPKVDSDFITADVTMQQGTPAEVTIRVVKRLEDSAAKLNGEYRTKYGKDLVVCKLSSIGDQPMSTMRVMGGLDRGPAHEHNACHGRRHKGLGRTHRRGHDTDASIG
jgi:multidrug efflux pump subunit AcrB